MANGYRSCSKSLCFINGGIIAPGQEAVHTDQGTFHSDCLPEPARAAYVSALAQRTVQESQARRAQLAAELAAQDVRLAATLAVLGRSGRTPTASSAS